MIDRYLKPLIDPHSDKIGKILAHKKISANSITLTGFLFGVIGCILISFKHYDSALLALIINRVLDAVDGAVARHDGATDFGGYLDIVLDFIIYAGVPFSFAVANHKLAFPVTFLIFSYVGTISSFLAYSIIAAKHKVETKIYGTKSFFFTGGLAEGFETMLAMFLMCLFPSKVALICYCYAIMCWITCFTRILQARNDFCTIEKKV